MGMGIEVKPYPLVDMGGPTGFFTMVMCMYLAIAISSWAYIYTILKAPVSTVVMCHFFTNNPS
jgi:hypothetical protein